MSIGLPSDASGARKPARRERTAAEISTTSSPADWQASAHMMPGPPALVTIATRVPAGTGWAASRAPTSNSSCIVSVRITPAWPKSASTVTSEADSSAPVCEALARAPAGERPLLTATIGLALLTLRAIRAKRRGLPNDSR